MPAPTGCSAPSASPRARRSGAGRRSHRPRLDRWPHPPRLEIAGRRPALSRRRRSSLTAGARIASETGAGPKTAPLAQLLDLAFPFSLYEQDAFLSEGIPALTVTTEGGRRRTRARVRRHRRTQLGRVGRAGRAAARVARRQRARARSRNEHVRLRRRASDPRLGDRLPLPRAPRAVPARARRPPRPVAPARARSSPGSPQLPAGGSSSGSGSGSSSISSDWSARGLRARGGRQPRRGGGRPLAAARNRRAHARRSWKLGDSPGRLVPRGPGRGRG